ncbi:hypothetical protein [Algoriphagus namhaensis]
MIFVLFGCVSDRGKGREIELIFDLEVVSPATDSIFNLDFENENMVVAYASNLHPINILGLDWGEVMAQHPDVTYLFYYSGKSKQELEEYMRRKEIDFPIFFDPEKKFYSTNIRDKVTGISFLVKNGRVYKLGNPSVPNFADDIAAMKGE